jgi:DNA modification methylase
MLNQCHLGCVLDVLPRLAAEGGLRAQMCVTSPPYWGLRDYGVPPSKWPAIEFQPMPGLPSVWVPQWEGCLGLEPSPLMFVAHMVHVFRLVREVLADDGTLWLNLGDSYAGSRSGPDTGSTLEGSRHNQNAAKTAKRRMTASRRRDDAPIPRSDVRVDGLKPKDLVGQPWRVAFALQADGWYLRMDNIWHKPCPMPESVRDRPTKAHEYLFLLAKSERYYYDADAIKEPVTGNAHSRGTSGVNPKAGKTPAGWDTSDGSHRELKGRYKPKQNPSYSAAIGTNGLVDMRNKRSVWTVASSPFPEAHFATFPPRLIEPCVLAGTSAAGHCPACGAPWERITEKSTRLVGNSSKAGRAPEEIGASGKLVTGGRAGNKNLKAGPCVSTTTLGWKPACACGLEPVPDLVLDPFGGSGTTAMVAEALARQWVTVELSPDYKDMHKRRAVGLVGLPLA